MISTHVMSIAENSSDNIIILNNGKIIFNRKLSEIKENNGSIESAISKMMK